MNKWLGLLTVLITFICSARATTVVLGGGAEGRKFGSIVQPGFVFTSSAAMIQVGRIEGMTFIPFALTDPTQPTFSGALPIGDPLAGMWTGDASDSSAAADAFNGQQIWFRVVFLVNSTMAYLTSSELFPINGAVGGDTITVNSRDLTIPALSIYTESPPIPTLPPNNTNFSYIDIPNDRIVIFAPEPGTALLFLLGGTGLLRRRR